MARTDTLPHFLTDVADAIRTKAGTSGTIQASTFDTAIANIPSGGGGSLTMAYADLNVPSSYAGNFYLGTFTNLVAKPKAFVLVIGAVTNDTFGATGGGNDWTIMRIWDGTSQYAIEHKGRFITAGGGVTTAVKLTIMLIDTAHAGSWNESDNSFSLNYINPPAHYASSQNIPYRLYYFY